jgi:hypothetical protein
MLNTLREAVRKTTKCLQFNSYWICPHRQMVEKNCVDNLSTGNSSLQSILPTFKLLPVGRIDVGKTEIRVDLQGTSNSQSLSDKAHNQ